VDKYRLPRDTTAFKDKDPNADRFRDQYGRLAVELDALSPDELTHEIERGLGAYLDFDTITEELEIQKQEISDIAGIRRDIIQHIESKGIIL